MSILFTEGFDHYVQSTTDDANLLHIGKRWRTVTLDSNLFYTYPTGQDGTGRCLQLSNSTDINNRAAISISPAQRSLCVGAAYYWTGGQQNIFWYSSTGGVTQLIVNSNGLLGIVINNTSYMSTFDTILPNTWNYFELQSEQIESGWAEVMAFRTNLTTQVTSRSVFISKGQIFTSNPMSYNVLYIGNMFGYSDGFLKRYDNLYISTGERYGSSRIRTIMPNGDVTKTWVPSSGSFNYAMVNETNTPTMASYVSTTSVGAKDVYDLQNPSILSSETISAVSPFTYTVKPEAGTESIRNNLVVNGTEVNGDSVALTTTTSTVIQNTAYEVNPVTGAAWTPADINALRIGPEKTA